jgi:hypothetical protein
MIEAYPGIMIYILPLLIESKKNIESLYVGGGCRLITATKNQQIWVIHHNYLYQTNLKNLKLNFLQMDLSTLPYIADSLSNVVKN